MAWGKTVRACALTLLICGLAEINFAAQDNDGVTSSATVNAQTNWPSFKNLASRIGFNAAETTINKSNAKFLTLAWQGQMGDLVESSSPAVVNGVVYVGSFDGKLYAFDANG